MGEGPLQVNRGQRGAMEGGGGAIINLHTACSPWPSVTGRGLRAHAGNPHVI